MGYAFHGRFMMKRTLAIKTNIIYGLVECIISFLSHLLIAGCDIGVQISVRPFVRPYVRPSVNIYVEVWFFRHQR